MFEQTCPSGQLLSGPHWLMAMLASRSLRPATLQPAPLPPESVDVVVMNGVLTERQGIPRPRMVELAEALVAAAFRAARHGIAFNAMSRHVDWEREDLFHWGFDEVAGAAVVVTAGVDVVVASVPWSAGPATVVDEGLSVRLSTLSEHAAGPAIAAAAAKDSERRRRAERMVTPKARPNRGPRPSPRNRRP